METRKSKENEKFPAPRSAPQEPDVLATKGLVRGFSEGWSTKPQF